VVNNNITKNTIMYTARAKFQCDSVTNFRTSQEVNLRAVNSKDGDNADFSKYTPSGSLNIHISAEAPAFNAFTPGKCYYLDFMEAPEQ